MTEKDEREFEARLPREKRWENLTFANDFIFGKVGRHPDVYPEMFRRILPDIDADEIELVEAQKTIDEAIDSGGVRLDIYARTKRGEDVDAEMQTVDRKDLPKRSRYCHAMLNLHQMSRPRPPGVKRSYNRLTRQFVIFICTFDPFGEGRYVYTFTNRCHEVAGLELDDGTVTIFLNAKGRGKISPELKSFLDYVASGKPTGDDPFIQRLDELVAEAKQRTEWRREYMTWTMESALRYDEGVDAGIILGRAEGEERGLRLGRAEGETKGREEALLATARRMKADGMSDAQIMKFTGLSLADIEGL